MSYMRDPVTGPEARERLRRDLLFRAAVPSDPQREALIAEVESFQWEHCSFSDPGAEWSKLHLTFTDGTTRSFHFTGAYD